MLKECNSTDAVLNEAPPIFGLATNSDIDVSLLKESLAMTPWERMQANDDALNFSESLRAAMKARNAKPE
jgi:hypothetical protein